MIMHGFVTHFHQAKFCGVPSYVFDKLGCAAGEVSVRNTTYAAAGETSKPLAFFRL
jgi:hypothetical protein